MCPCGASIAYNNYRMATAIRSDLLAEPYWTGYVKFVRSRGDAVSEVQCSTCEVQYAITLAVSEDCEAAVKLLRQQLRRDCPDHGQESYTIKGDLPGQIVAA
jgi:hypothetical protein